MPNENMSVIKKITASGLMWIWVALIVLAADRASKYWVMDNLMLYEPKEVLPFFNLTLAYNTGAAFGFLHNMPGWQNWFLGSLAGIVSIIVICWLSKLSVRDWWASIALALILGGALGNAWDRILYHYVVDFLSFHIGDWHYAIFNVADSAIDVGAVMLLLKWFKQNKEQSA